MTPAERANPASTSRVGDMLSSTIATTLADIHASAAPAAGAGAAAAGGGAATAGTKADQQRKDEEPQQEQQGGEAAEQEELAGLKVNALLQRAQAAGVDDVLLDDAMVRS
jgi:hypothetical protein